MVIYLENTFAANWYVPGRVRWARITANQGAVIIENARIHERSGDLVAASKVAEAAAVKAFAAQIEAAEANRTE